MTNIDHIFCVSILDSMQPIRQINVANSLNTNYPQYGEELNNRILILSCYLRVRTVFIHNNIV